MITYSINAVKSKVEVFKFPGGELGVRLIAPVRDGDRVRIKAHIQNSDDIMTLLLLVDAIRREAIVTLILDLPYVPYARQDRVCNEGESLSIGVFASLINSCNFDRVFITDPHSDVTPALIKNCVIIDQVAIFENVKQDWSNTVIVAPDAGAMKKAYDFAKRVGAADVLVAEKVRDVKTGKIVSVSLSGVFSSEEEYFILDDICDGGRTFLELVTEFPDCVRRIDLAVTHGIFSKGVEVVAERFDNVYTTTSFHGKALESEAKNVFWKEV